MARSDTCRGCLVSAQGRLQNKPSHSLSSAGKGLGRKENGITQALKVTLKQDTHGVSQGSWSALMGERILEGKWGKYP
jgi:hypothetical protein